MKNGNIPHVHKQVKHDRRNLLMTVARFYFKWMAIFFVPCGRFPANARRTAVGERYTYREIQRLPSVCDVVLLHGQGYGEDGMVVNLATWWPQRVTTWPFEMPTPCSLQECNRCERCGRRRIQFNQI